MGELQDQAKRLADVAAKLLHEAERLRRDVRGIAKYIVTLEGDALSEYVPWGDRTPRNFRDMFEVLNKARLGLEGAERDIGTIKSAMDVIVNDVVSREEMKPFLIDPSRKKDRGQ